MPESKGGKVFAVVALVALAVGGYFGWIQLSWFRLEMAARDAISDAKLKRFPDDSAVAAVPTQIKSVGAQRGFPKLEVKMLLQQRKMGPITVWFIQAQLKSESFEFTTEKRMEADWEPGDYEVLREAGYTLEPL